MTWEAHNNHVDKVEKDKSKNNSKSICPRDLKKFLELHTNDPKEPLIFLAEEIIISLVIKNFWKIVITTTGFLMGKSVKVVLSGVNYPIIRQLFQ